MNPQELGNAFVDKQEIHQEEDVGTKQAEESDLVEAIEPRLEKALLRKLDLLMMPVSMALYLFSSLDRGNVGNARLMGMIGPPDGYALDPTGASYALLAAMFYIGYSVFLVPSGLLSKRLTKPYLQVSIAALIWGTASTCTAATQSWGQAYACRFIMAIGEAGYQPTLGLMLARWYQHEELAFRFSLFYCTGALSGCINGLIAYGLTFSQAALAPWRLLYIVDGIPTIVWGLAAFYLLPADLYNTKRLSAAERDLAQIRYSRQGTREPPQFRWRQAVGVLWAWQVMLPVLTNCCLLLVAAVLGVFLPTLIKQAGYTGALAQLYTLPAYGSAFVSMLACGMLSDRTGRRGPFVIYAFTMMLLGGILITVIPPVVDEVHRNSRYAGLCFICIGVYTCIPLNQTPVNETRRSMGLPLFMACGQAAGVASGYMFPANEAPAYRAGCLGITFLSLVGLVTSIVYVALCIAINRRRDKVEGQPDPAVIVNTAEHGHQAKGFRYKW